MMTQQVKQRFKRKFTFLRECRTKKKQDQRTIITKQPPRDTENLNNEKHVLYFEVLITPLSFRRWKIGRLENGSIENLQYCFPPFYHRGRFKVWMETVYSTGIHVKSNLITHQRSWPFWGVKLRRQAEICAHMQSACVGDVSFCELSPKGPT